MSRKKDSKEALPEAASPEEVTEFFETHSLADYEEEFEEVEIEVRAKRRRRITLTPEVYEKIEEEARLRGVSPETLANLWLSERLGQERAA